ncbi:probable ATP-dependent RNA helicase DDX31 [Melanaphis sacchari]|uniref:ATP-dependent RNA helicase n=1 Tax=Melanaphis sacchari TaxID=742174 RepID=A0A2H8THA8_9HEMI|nr:probable ATP-dependent RNA helicase DDX31 [Melanaphis sacchari]
MNCDEFGDGLENDCIINREKDPVNSKVFGVNRRSNFSRKEKGNDARLNGKHSNNQKRNNNDKKSGYVSSMFRNNPEVQLPVAILNKQVDIQAINKNKNSLFSTSTYKDLTDLHPHMIANLEQTLGVTKLTTVQSQTIPILQSGKDAMVQSETGSGKTFAYAVPLIESLHKIRPKLSRTDGLRALIILPTRELALQTYENFVKLLKPYTWLVPGMFTGGEKRKSEKARMRKGITILIGTPGRLLDHAQNTKSISFKSLQWLIIDEADRMLDLGYEKDITSILSIINEHRDESIPRQTALLSATLSEGVQRLAGLSLKDPVYIDASSIGDTDSECLAIPDSLLQYYVLAPPKLRLVTLSGVLLQKLQKGQISSKTLVFMATQDMVDFYTELLTTVLTCLTMFKLHGNMTQVERMEVFKSFKAADHGVLFCTDVASRGLDLPLVDRIIQYNAPITPTDYVHRVGRTARVGQKGEATLFLTPHEAMFIAKLQDHSIIASELKMDKCLTSILTMEFEGENVKTVEMAANILQSRFETAVLEQDRLHELGCNAFKSWVRSYASYPKSSREVFNFKDCHLGHYAKSFAIRDAPRIIGGIGKPKKDPRMKNQRKIPKTDSGALFKKRKSDKVISTSEFDSGMKAKKRKMN